MILKQSRFISVSINASGVKAAQVSNSGLVEKIGFKPATAANASAVLRDLVSGFHLKDAGILCVMPADVATTKLLEVPSTDPTEIDSIIAIQATRHTPFNKDEIITSYIKIGNPKPHFTQLLLVVVKRDAVKEKLAVLRGAGLNTSAVIFASEAVARFYAKATVVKKNEKTAILDVSMQSSSFMITSDVAPLMARSMPVGIESVVCDAGAFTQIVDEVKASIAAFEQETSTHLSRVIMTTDHMALAGLDKMLHEAIKIPIDILPYTNLIKGVKGISEQLAKEFSDESALDVIACAVAAGKCCADLVPQEIKEQRAVAERGRQTFKAGVLVLLTLLFIGCGLLSQVYFKDMFLKQNLVEKYADQKKEVDLLANLINKTHVMRDYLVARQLPLEAIRELYRIIPQEVYLSNISMDDAGNVSIQGISESMSRVFSVVSALEESPLFENVKTKSTTAKKDRGKDAAAFEIILVLTPTR